MKTNEEQQTTLYYTPETTGDFHAAPRQGLQYRIGDAVDESQFPDLADRAEFG